MSELVIMSLEDEPEVREAICRDLGPFLGSFRIEEAEDVEDAREVISECLEAGDIMALILCDHLLPGTKGADFLVELNSDDETAPIKKILVTGQATHEDTIRAVNDAGLDYYISKPWKPEALQKIVREQLTNFVIDEVEDLLPYVAVLDGSALLEAMKDRVLTD